MTEYLADLEADFRVFYRVEEMFEMGSARFLRFAERTPYYKGVMRRRVEAEQEEQDGGQATGPERAQRVESTPAAMATSFSEDIEYASV